MQSTSRARWQILGAAALFSTGGAAIKACEFGSWHVAGLRSGIAVLALLAFVPAARRWPSGREWLVGIAYAATLTLFVAANKLTTSANTIFLQSTAPLYLLLLGPWLLHERITRRDLAFMLAMALGLACFFVDENKPISSATNPKLGNQLALASGVGWALTMAGLRWLGRGKADTEDAQEGLGAVIAGNTLAFGAASVACIVLGLGMPHGSITSWAVAIYLGVFQIGLAYLFVTSALRKIGAFEASVLLLVEPVMSPLWAWIFHGERPGPWALVGGAILVFATLVKTWWDARRVRRAGAA